MVKIQAKKGFGMDKVEYTGVHKTQTTGGPAIKIASCSHRSAMLWQQAEPNRSTSI